jgi:galactonate dehydratase
MKRAFSHAPAFFAPPPGANHPLAIAAFRAWRLREPVSARRYTVVKLSSQNGAVGFGEGGPASAAEIAEAREAITGRRATELEFIRHRLTAIPSLEAAVGNAMLDLVSRSKGVPVYQYLGGPTRFKARLLAQLETTDESGMSTSLERGRRAGFRAFTMPIPPRESMSLLQDWVNHVRKHVADMRARGGEESEWVFDGAAKLTPGDAATLAVALERTHPIWFDEPIAMLTTDALAKIVDQSVMPVGLGRKITDIAVFQNLLRFGSVNVLRPALGLNSLTKIKRMAALAETHYVAVAPYHSGGPIGTVAGIHLNAALPNSYAQEAPVPAADRDAAMRSEITSGNREIAENGFAVLVNRPGIGVDVNESALDRYSEERV